MNVLDGVLGSPLDSGFSSFVPTHGVLTGCLTAMTRLWVFASHAGVIITDTVSMGPTVIAIVGFVVVVVACGGSLGTIVVGNGSFQFSNFLGQFSDLLGQRGVVLHECIELQVYYSTL